MSPEFSHASDTHSAGLSLVLVILKHGQAMMAMAQDLLVLYNINYETLLISEIRKCEKKCALETKKSGSCHSWIRNLYKGLGMYSLIGKTLAKLAQGSGFEPQHHSICYIKNV